MNNFKGKKNVSVSIFCVVVIFTIICVFTFSSYANGLQRNDEKASSAPNIVEQLNLHANFDRTYIPISTNNKETIRTSNEQIALATSSINISVHSQALNKEYYIKLYNTNGDTVGVHDNAYFTSSTNNTYNKVTRFFDGGFQRSFILNNQNAPEMYKCRFEIPEGYKFKYSIDETTGEPDGSIELVDTMNNPVAAILKPWAIDNAGTPVDTKYIINGSTIIQTVLHQNKNYTYPIIADPSAQYNKWFSGTKWVKNPAGWTLSVDPSASLINSLYEKKGSATASVTNTSWNVLYNQHHSSSHWKNTNGLKDQYKCHVYNAPNKSKWNLDTWRPDVGYLKTVLHACNP